MIPRKVITTIGSLMFGSGFLLAWFLHEVGQHPTNKLLVALSGILFLICLIAAERKLKRADKEADFMRYSLCMHMNEDRDADYFCPMCRFYMCTYCAIGHKEMHKDLTKEVYR